MTAGRVLGVLMRFLVGTALAAGAGWAAYQILGGFPPAAPQSGEVAIWRPLAAMLAGAIAVFGLAVAVGAPAWRRVLWAVRGAILAELVLAWLYYDHTGYVEWGEAAGLLGLLLVLHHVSHRHALGWIVDDQGERQKVLHWHRGRAVMTTTTWQQRMLDEALQKSERRKTLAFSLLAAAPSTYGAYWLYTHRNWIALIGVGIIAVPVWLFGVLPSLLSELLYQIGYQDMRGAKVLDPEVRHPGIDQIAAEKAHGDANLADENEALGFLGRKT